MDPFLEVNPRWEGFHGWFVRKLAEQTLPQARARGLWIDVERSVYRREPTGEFVLVGEPDELVGVQDGGTPAEGSSLGSATAVLVKPQAVRQVAFDPDEMEQFKQSYLVVRELGRFTRVVAVAEVLSPANKSGNYAPRYREKRRWLLASQAHFVEIDLLRGGTNPSRDLFPELGSAPYFLFVARKQPDGRIEEGYALGLQDELPTLGLPVSAAGADLPLDLASAFRSAYELSIHPGAIDYAQEDVPPPPLSEGDAAWVDDLLKAKGLRTS
jgi:hypothetical protein